MQHYWLPLANVQLCRFFAFYLFVCCRPKCFFHQSVKLPKCHWWIKELEITLLFNSRLRGPIADREGGNLVFLSPILTDLRRQFCLFCTYILILQLNEKLLNCWKLLPTVESDVRRFLMHTFAYSWPTISYQVTACEGVACVVIVTSLSRCQHQKSFVAAADKVCAYPWRQPVTPRGIN